MDIIGIENVIASNAFRFERPKLQMQIGIGRWHFLAERGLQPYQVPLHCVQPVVINNSVKKAFKPFFHNCSRVELSCPLWITFNLIMIKEPKLHDSIAPYKSRYQFECSKKFVQSQQFTHWLINRCNSVKETLRTMNLNQNEKLTCRKFQCYSRHMWLPVDGSGNSQGNTSHNQWLPAL